MMNIPTSRASKRNQPPLKVKQGDDLITGPNWAVLAAMLIKSGIVRYLASIAIIYIIARLSLPAGIIAAIGKLFSGKFP